ncbi:hypothetical protein HHK36_006557 [Tetracentron sinense]|uniref:RING-type E3 ubiquitin transferase n=1 Tax=Tetracentron sinense TaxID=13715 RepID=A0A834ZHP8_TETSI|nr:hypothetical protein HHK36_006557 [Tetracentron sinense]
MSFAGGGGGGGAAAPQSYFCHQCERTVSVTPSPSSDLSCPICNGDFLEESQNPNPNPNPNPAFAFSDTISGFPSFFPGHGGGGFPLLFNTSSSVDLQNPTNISLRQRQDSDVFNPFLFLQNYLQTLTATAGGANIQLVSDQGFRLPTNLDDYFIGPGLEQLIQQLAENDPSRYGTPPASKSAVDALLNIKISDELLESESAQCAVCKDLFEFGAEVKQMPCKHIYHSDCILPWLAMHNSCPVCRYELPTDDPDSQNQAVGTPVAANSAVDAALVNSGFGGVPQDNPPTPRTAERMFRISLPWPLRTLSSPAETSNSGAGTGGSNNDGESNSGGQGTMDSVD